MPTQSEPIPYADLKAFVANCLSDDYRFFAPVTVSPFKPFNAKMGLGIESPDLYEHVDRLLERLPVLQEQSRDPDEEGDLPVSDATVRQMRFLINVLASHFIPSAPYWRQSSLSASPAGDLEMSWRFNGNSLVFIAKSDAIVGVVKKAGEQPERHVLSGTVAGSMTK